MVVDAAVTDEMDRLIEIMRAALDVDPGVSTAFMTGSRAVGLGNLKSDVDVMCVCASDPPEPTSWADGQEVTGHIEYVSVDQVQEWCRTANSAPWESSRYPRVLDTAPAVKRLPRVVLGRPIVHNEAHAELVDSVDQDRLCQLVMTYSSAMSVAYLRDALGAVEVDDRATALETSATSLRWSMHAALAAVGDTYFGEKWIARRFGRAPQISGTMQRAVLEALLAPDPFALDDDGACTQIVERRLDLVGQLTCMASLYGWSSRAKQLPELVVKRGRVARSAVVPFADGLLFVGDAGPLLPRLVASVWLLADDDARFDRFAASLTREHGAQTRRRLKMIKDHLVDRGLLAPTVRNGR